MEKSKDLIFLEKLLTIEKVEELQSNIEVKENLSIWKYDFFLQIVAPILTPVAQELLEQSNKTLCGFTSIKLLNHSLPRVSRIRLKCRRQLQQLLKLEVRLYLGEAVYYIVVKTFFRNWRSRHCLKRNNQGWICN